MEKIEVKNANYKFSIYIKVDEIIINLKYIDPPREFRNNYTLNSLKILNPEHIFDGGIEKWYNIMKKRIEETKYKIKENEANLEIKIINHDYPIEIKQLEFIIILKEIKIDNSDIKYDLLSNDMKKLIDNDNLILGIDLGTTYSTSALMVDEKIIVIPNSLGLRNTPSYVMFLGPNERCVGDLAKLYPLDNGKIIFDSKRLLGKRKKEIENETFSENFNSNLVDVLPFSIVETNDKLKIKIKFDSEEKEFYPEEISAMVIKKIVEDSECYLTEKIGTNIKIKKAIITCPANFNQKQREATIQAAEIINLKVVRMINEPTAASLAYAYKSIENRINKYITIIDFGGGTLDITLLKFIKNDDGIYCDIQFSYGKSNFGGEDFDKIIMEHCIKSTKSQNLDQKLPCNIRLKRACEIAKINLSSMDITKIILEEYLPLVSINENLKRGEFEKICQPLFKDFEMYLNDFLKQSGFYERKKDIKEIILIGGSTLIPKINTIIKKVFNYSIIKTDLNPKEAVAIGASIQGAIKANLPIMNKLNLLDVTNLSLGVKVLDSTMSKIIKRSTPIPNYNSDTYFTTYDYQTTANIEIYEGENIDVKKNLFLGRFVLSGLPKLKKGEAKLKICISISESSLLDVSAEDLSNSKNHKSIEIKRPEGLKDIIDDLKDNVKHINNSDLDEYNEIKKIVIDYQEEINYITDKKKRKEKYELLIHYFGCFLRNFICNNNREKIYISYVAYYFKLVNNYLLFNEKINKNFIEKIKIDLENIMNHIQCYNSEIICYFIEYFRDSKELYSFCLLLLVNYYYAIIESLFRQNKSIENFEESIENLNELRAKVKSCQKLLEKIEVDSIEIIKLKETIRDYEIALDGREIIKKYLNGKNINYDQLNKLINDYNQSKYIDFDDLIILNGIITKNNDDGVEGIADEKVERLIKKLNEYTRYQDLFEYIYYILNEFPPIKYDLSQLKNLYYENKSGLILKLRGLYSNAINIETNIDKIKIFDRILAFLNNIE